MYVYILFIFDIAEIFNINFISCYFVVQLLSFYKRIRNN